MEKKVYGAMTIAYKPSFQYIQQIIYVYTFKVLYIYLENSFTAVSFLWWLQET